MKKKITMLLLSLLAIFTIILFWIKQLTNIGKFDIFEDIDGEEDWN